MDMDVFKSLPGNRTNLLPDSPGVYAFRKKGRFLYIGKAASIKRRVKSHFHNPSYKDRIFLRQIKKIGYIKTGSEIEALTLEARLIKKYQPRYNVMWKDDKNYFYVAVTTENYPRVFITHRPEKNSESKYIGPFVDGNSLKKALKFLRKTFPYLSVRKHQKSPCLYCHLNLCPGPNPDIKEYKNNLNKLKGVLFGKKNPVLKKLKKEMIEASQKSDFEKAAAIRDRVRALESILANGKIFASGQERHSYGKTEKELCRIIRTKRQVIRIEAYDISNIQGRQSTGSMVTFIKGAPDKNFYRKFKIKITGKPNDTAMIKEVVLRRLSHPEWPYPDLILIDGGKAQLNAALFAKNERGLAKEIAVAALAKRNNELFIENKKNPVLLKNLPQDVSNLMLHLRDEAHRFARKYHHRLREVELRPKR